MIGADFFEPFPEENALNIPYPLIFRIKINYDTVFTNCYKNETKHNILWSGVCRSQEIVIILLKISFFIFLSKSPKKYFFIV